MSTSMRITAVDEDVNAYSIDIYGINSFEQGLESWRAVQRVAADLGFSLKTEEEYQSDLRYNERRVVGDHKHTVRDGLIEYYRDVRGGYNWKEELNGILKHFGYEQLVSKFRVTVTDDATATDVLSIIVEADDEDEALALVEPNVSVYSACLTIDYQYDGDGEVEDQNPIEDEDDGLAEGYCLSFVAEPYDE